MADDEARIVSVIGACRRTSRWRVAEDNRVLALFGRCLLDLREAETDGPRLGFDILSVFASVEIIVPEGSDVQPSGLALLAAAQCEVPPSSEPGPLPPIEIDSVTVFGRLRVHVGQLSPRRSLLSRLLRRGRDPGLPAAPPAVPLDAVAPMEALPPSEPTPAPPEAAAPPVAEDTLPPIPTDLGPPPAGALAALDTHDAPRGDAVDDVDGEAIEEGADLDEPPDEEPAGDGEAVDGEAVDEPVG
jgi:hypothetical protein